MMNRPNPNQLKPEWLEHDAAIRPYLWSHRSLRITEKGLGICFLVYLLATRSFNHVEFWIQGFSVSPYLQWLIYFGFFSLLWKLIVFPLDVGHYLIERRFELSKQKLGSWLWDQAKGLLVGVVLVGIVLSVIYWLVHVLPLYWWFWSFVFLFCFSILLAQLAPVIFIPMFFKLKPMPASELKDRLLNLCRKYSIEVKDIYHLGLGEKTEKGNAAFVGLGKTKQIIIGDTLYEKFSHDQVEAVFAHELGHQVNNDIWRGIGVGAILMFVSFFLGQWICNQFLLEPFYTQFSKPAGMTLFFIVFSLLQVPLGILQVLHSRKCENAADDFAANSIGVGDALGAALEKLVSQNRGQYVPHPWVEFLSYSHPAPWRRITRLN